MPVREDPDWDAVLHLFSNQWFRRVWCIQEVVLAKKPVVLSGNSSVEWETFVNAGRWVKNNSFIRTTSREHRRTLEHLDVLQKMRDTRKNTHWLERHSLLQLVFLTRGFEATDPRDKLFALVGLASDVMSSDWEVTPDYDLSLTEVYRRFAPWHLTRNRQVEIFSLGTNRDLPSSEELEALPSWVPDLRRPDMAAPLPKLDYLSPNYIDIRYDILKGFRARAHHLKNAINVGRSDELYNNSRPLLKPTVTFFASWCSRHYDDVKNRFSDEEANVAVRIWRWKFLIREHEKLHRAF